MPELPEVETIKTAICNSVGNCSINNLIVNNYRLRQPVPKDIKGKICGTKITKYRRIAKYIVIDLSNGLSIIWHMGMSGKVKIMEQLPEVFEKHDHIAVETDNGCLIFNDARRFGLFTYAETSTLEKHPFFCKLGPEPFDKDFSAAYFYNKLHHKKVPIKVALLDQEIVVGIGNIYASESLFGAGISPLRPADELSFAEAEKLLKEIRNVLKKAIKAGGSTLRDYQKPDGSLGYFQNMHCVYNKTGQKCPQCTCDVNQTGGIQKTVQAGRSSFYCPVKQK